MFRAKRRLTVATDTQPPVGRYPADFANRPVTPQENTGAYAFGAVVSAKQG
jgi:hypothetical protein